YRQRLPYEVLLDIDGFLSEPEISFGLDLPQKYQVNYPQIATKLSMLNSEQMTSELNKQVFALLVTGSFIPDNPFASGEGGSQGIATTAARNSVNGILSAQLNKLSSKYAKGFEVNFDLTTYDDYGGETAQTRTELDVEVQKKLFDERLTVEASSTFDVEGEQQSRPGSTSQQLYGEFAVTYDLTESGDYKVRAYRENAYDIFDGEVAYSGLAFIIQKSFNKLKNMFKKDEPNQEAVKEEEEENDEENDEENSENKNQ
ncbi:MAG: translocation/assembly module TamB domain-containing protein, partial [Bacteroidota bacterium]